MNVVAAAGAGASAPGAWAGSVVDTAGPVVRPLLEALWRASWQAALIAVVLLALQAVLRDRLAARWRHALWLLVFVRLALPVLPRSPTSALNWIDARADALLAPLVGPDGPRGGDVKIKSTTATTAAATQRSSPSSSSSETKTPPPSLAPSEPGAATQRRASADPIQGPAASRATDATAQRSAARSAADVAGNGAQPPAVPTAQPRPRERSQARALAISLIWLAGAAALLLRIIVSSVRLGAIRRRLAPITSMPLLDLLDDARAELRVRRRVTLLASESMLAPALMGMWRPAVVLPRHVVARMSRSELRLVLLHELAHVKRHDLAINWLTALLSAVHWFNPLVWVVMTRLRTDRELACDEMVLARGSAADDGRRAAYGAVLVKLIEAIAAAAAQPVPCRRRRPPRAGTAILENAHQLERRVKWIATFAPRRRAWSVLALVAAVLLCATLMTAPVAGKSPRTLHVAAPAPQPATPSKPLEFTIEVTCPITMLSQYLESQPDLARKLTGFGAGSPATKPATQPATQPSPERQMVGQIVRETGDPNEPIAIAEAVWQPGQAIVPQRTAGGSVERLAQSVVRRRKQAEAEAQVILDAIEKFRREHPGLLLEEAMTKQLVTSSQALLEARLHLLDVQAKYGKDHAAVLAAQKKCGELEEMNEEVIRRTGEWNKVNAEHERLKASLAQKQQLIRRLDDRAVALEEMGQIVDAMRAEERGGGGGAGATTNPVGQEASGVPARLIVVDEKIAAANDAAARVLETPVSELVFDRTPMREVLERFRRLAPGTNVYIDWNACMTVGVDQNFPVTLTLRNVPLGGALAQTLRAAQDQAAAPGARTRLTWLLDHGNVAITTDEEADKILFTITYDVSDLTRDAQRLERIIALVRQAVRPQVWRESGGHGEIGGFGSKLVVTVSDSTHREIAKLLAGLRAAPTTVPAQ